MNRSDRGYASFTVFALILLITAVIIAVSTLFYQSQRSLSRFQHDLVTEKNMLKEVNKMMSLIANDKSVDSDSRFDQLWSYLDQKNDYQMTLEEASSRLNPNFDNFDFWRQTTLKSHIKNRYGFNEWEKDRIVLFGYGEQTFKDILIREDWEKLYSLNTFLNPNTAPIEIVEGYLRQNGYNEDRISNVTSQLRNIQKGNEKVTQQEISSWLATGDTPTPAVINAQSRMNVNFIDPLILEAILSYPWNGESVDNYLVLKNNILNARNTYEVTEEKLSNLLNCDQEIRNRMLRYLGTSSWFWKLKIEDDEYQLSTLICRTPSISGRIEETGIQIVNNVFKKKDNWDD